MSDEFYWIAVAVTTVLSASRLTRLFVADKFPPTYWLRHRYADALDGSDRSRAWALLLFCGYCFGFWATLGVMLWGYLAGVYDLTRDLHADSIQVWWFANGAFGGSYLAAWFMANDGDDSEDD